jgi:hypothetical protein
MARAFDSPIYYIIFQSLYNTMHFFSLSLSLSLVPPKGIVSGKLKRSRTQQLEKRTRPKQVETLTLLLFSWTEQVELYTRDIIELWNLIRHFFFISTNIFYTAKFILHKPLFNVLLFYFHNVVVIFYEFYNIVVYI